MEIVALPPLVADRACVMDARGAETLVVAVKGTWSLGNGSALTPSDRPQPIRLAPEYRGEPTRSSLLYESDLALAKPGTDCVLLGRAYAPRGRARQVQVTFAVGKTRQTAVVFGDRFWVRSLGMTSSTPPAEFESIPLTYENSFGGAESPEQEPPGSEFCATNPVGKGFRAESSRRPPDGTPLPNIEDPSSLVARPTSRPGPVGFGFIAPDWQPRVRYAGTFDARWQRDVSPLLPEDFDSRFFCAAPPPLVSQPHLRGDEEVLAENVAPGGRLQFRLPRMTPRVTVRLDLQSVDLPVTLETVILEPDERRVQLVWGARLGVHERLYDVRWIRVEGRPQ